MTFRQIPLVLLMGLLVPVLDGPLTVRNLITAGALALAVGVPFVFLVGVCAQMLPSSWYEE
jgi:hypothetical protein